MMIKVFAVLSALAAVFLCVVTEAFQSLMWLWMLPVGFLGSFLIQMLLLFLFLVVITAPVNPNKQREEDSKFFRGVVHLVIDAAFTLARIRVETEGLEKTPKDGRFLLVSNHQHDSDPAVIMHYFKKSQLAFVGKRETKEFFLIGKLMSKILCQFINRENDREALKTILRCISLLKEDKVSVGIFPEGYIHPDRKLYPFRPGVFKIAQKANVPIVVCTLQDTKYIFSNFFKGKPTNVKLHLLDVIPAEALQGRTTVDIAEEIYAMMAKDLGPENVHQETEDNT